MLLYDVDIETSAAKIAEIKTWGGAKVVCYFEAGTWVKTRPWASKYSGAAGATGKTVSGAIGFPYEAPYTNELWVNPSDPSVRSVMKDVILPFAKARGCDMVEPDNVQGFERDSYCTGFEAKTGANCGSCKAGSPANKNFYIDKKCDADYKAWLDFNKFLADSAHALGMGIALKNNHHQAAELVKYHDFVLAEQCTSFGSSYSNGTTIGASLLGSKAKDCVGFVPFLKAGKGVALTAYTGTIAKACTDAAPYLPFGGLNTILKKTSLKSTRKACCGAVPCGVGSIGATTPKPLAR
ncbi:glycoside hydrolase superfamily [Obelidium mucronatum]|nr:glycoside hydrolase superfamily [Obelidium mucronatum]